MTSIKLRFLYSGIFFAFCCCGADCVYDWLVKDLFYSLFKIKSVHGVPISLEKEKMCIPSFLLQNRFGA
jgi:hypothetical protein